MTAEEKLFELALKEKLRESLNNKFCDNDPEYLLKGLNERMTEDEEYFKLYKRPNLRDVVGRKVFNDEVNMKSYLYSLLIDDNSKEKLLTTAAYNILGHRFVKFEYNKEGYREELLAINEKYNLTHKASTKILKLTEQAYSFASPPVTLYDFSEFHFGTMYSSADIIYTLKNGFQQYKYCTDTVAIAPDKGDVVLDCGAGMGDNSLIFSSLVGETGKVFSFEPNPNWKDIIVENIENNEDDTERIEIVYDAVWNTDEDVLKFKAEEYASAKIKEDGDCSVRTIRIDTFVKKQKLDSVDFIKMDIEGAELNALKGAENTIVKYQPKLAISVYHNLIDFLEIPRYIQSLDMGYEFYLDHHSPFIWETILYAKLKNKNKKMKKDS